MLALSPARDLSASTKATYHHLPSSVSLSDLSLTPLHLIQSSFTTCHRQQAFVETPAQRRARVAFVQKQNRGEQRVESWVREQAQQSAFMIAAAKMSTEKAKVKGHKRSGSVHHPEILPRKGVSDELMLRRTLKDSSNLPSIVEEEEEPYVFYSTPLPQYPTATTYHVSKTSHSPTRPSHQRRLSDLAVIPEGLEE